MSLQDAIKGLHLEGYYFSEAQGGKSRYIVEIDLVQDAYNVDIYVYLLIFVGVMHLPQSSR